MKISDTGSLQPVIPRDLDTEQKLHALNAVLSSSAFSRSEQLRKFLKYVCETEMQGRPDEITEYSIGVEALGRTATFSPAEDGIVRNRAHALRQKLLEYYTRESPHSKVVIDLPRGSYVPRFFPGATLVVEPVPVPVSAWPWRTNLGFFLLGLVAAATVAGVIFFQSLSTAEPRLDAVVREAWGPLALPGADVTFVMAYPYHLALRTYPPGSSPENAAVSLVAPPTIQEEYRRRMPDRGGEVHMQIAAATRLGEILGLVSALRVMHAAGASYQVVPDRAVTLTSLRNRNVILFGDPNMTPIVGKYLERGVYSIDYEPLAHDYVIRYRKGATNLPPAEYQASARNAADVREFPGLLTVLPSDGSDGRKRTVVLSAANSSGSQAAAEFFCSPQSLMALRERFAREGITGFPKAYQVILKAKAEGQSVLSYSFVTAHVLER